MMLKPLKQLNHLTTCHASRGNRKGLPLLAGMVAIGWHNWRLWQRDKQLIAEQASPTALPALEDWADLPLVSVLVAAWKEKAHIEALIESFMALRYPHKELVLCAGGSDATYQLAQAWVSPHVKVLEQQVGEGKQGALRRSLAYASGQIIFLTDADCLLDNESFEQTIYLLICGQEEVCTGTSRPSAAQWHQPFVAAQVASQLYGTFLMPPYAAGLLGRNCAIRRELLVQSKGLDAFAPTGTDYVLAKMLVQAGAQIRQVPQSRIQTNYPTTIRAYMRQQRRWLRNVVVHGRRFGALDEVQASLKTSLIGLGMLLMPLFGLLMPLIILAWLLLLWHTWLSRVRYLSVVSSVLGLSVGGRQIVWQAGMMLIDFLTWSQALLDYALSERQEEW